MCSFRCSLHKNSDNSPASATHSQLNARRSAMAMANSLVRIGGVEREWARRASTAALILFSYTCEGETLSGRREAPFRTCTLLSVHRRWLLGPQWINSEETKELFRTSTLPSVTTQPSMDAFNLTLLLIPRRIPHRAVYMTLCAWRGVCGSFIEHSLKITLSNIDATRMYKHLMFSNNASIKWASFYLLENMKQIYNFTLCFCLPASGRGQIRR